MKKYTGSWSANNGSTYASGYTSNNKRQLAKEMREIAQGNVFAGNTGHWNVHKIDAEGNENYDPILSGMVRN